MLLCKIWRDDCHQIISVKNRYIDDHLSFDNIKSGKYVNVIYPSELEITDTINSLSSISYLN